MKRSKEQAVYERPVCKLVDGKFVWSVEPQPVRVMARAEGYAMVRVTGGMPFVAPEKCLRPVQ